MVAKNKWGSRVEDRRPVQSNCELDSGELEYYTVLRHHWWHTVIPKTS